MSSSLIGCPIHLALYYIEAKSFVNYYSWLCTIRISYGIDNSTTMILRFALTEEQYLVADPCKILFFRNSFCHPGRLAGTSQFPLDLRRFWSGTARCLFVCFKRNTFLGWNSWFRFHTILYKSDQLFQNPIMLAVIWPVTKSCLIGVEDMLQCLWFILL